VERRGFALITGGSRGIGYAIAEELAKKGVPILLVGKELANLKERADRLQAKYGVEVHGISIDLLNEDAPKRIYDWCMRSSYSIKFLINNAGVGLTGLFDELSIEKQLELIRINVSVVTELSYLFTPNLRTYKKGYILNVSDYATISTAGDAVYTATKSYVRTLSKMLRKELVSQNVYVSCLLPSRTETEFYRKAENTNEVPSGM
jgi:hypothetical protein